MAKRGKKRAAAKRISLEPVKKALARVHTRLIARKKRASPEEKRVISAKIRIVKQLARQAQALCAPDALIFRPPITTRDKKR